MQRTRYSAIDVYTLEELWREYQASEPRGRIRLLKKLYRDDRRPPYEIAQMAVEDPHVEVRQWMARYGRSLDYREQGIRFLPDVHEAGPETESEGGSGKKCEIEWRFPERDLAARLKNDPDLFVRACLRENPEVFNAYSYEAWREYFLEATHLERLALLRNTKIRNADELIQKIFDKDDQELGIDPEARQQLAWAYLTNAKAMSDAPRKSYDFVSGWFWSKSFTIGVIIAFILYLILRR